MAWWGWMRRALLGSAGGASYEFDSAPRPIDRAIMEFAGRGGTVSRAEALRVPAVAKGRNLICSVSTLPLQERGPDLKVIRSPLLEQIDPNVPNVVTMANTLEDLLFDGVAWWRVLARGADQFPVSCQRVDPARVQLDKGVVRVDGQVVPAADMKRFDSPNGALRVFAASSIRRAARYQEAADLYAANPQMTDYFSPEPNADVITDDDAREYISHWRAARRKGGTGWIPAGMRYNAVSAPTAADMKLIELQQRAALDLANFLGVDPEVLGVSTTSRTYANAQDWRRDRINDVYAPYMAAISQRLTMGDFTRRGYTVVFDLDEYMRANPTERWTVYGIALDKGVMSVEEIRTEEGLPAGAPPAPAAAPAPAPAPAGDELSARRLARAFDADRPGVVEFSATRVGFTVDANTRTVRGLALPYGEIASKWGVKYRFAKGSLKWSEDLGRVKMLRDHDFTQPLGRATAITDGGAGLETTFKLARGPESDRALELAEDGVLDGLSVGVEFDDRPEAGDVVPDPDNDGVLLVKRAKLREVSLTAMPAFDGARVTTVAASRDNGGTMKCTTCGAPLVPGVAHVCATPPAAAPTPEQFAAQFHAAFPGLFPAPPAAPEPVGPAVVDPAGPGALPLSVTEAPPYRLVFDAQGFRQLRPGSHDFSRDLIASTRGDAAAGDRVQEFIRAAFDVDRADAVALNPNGYRPEMYVDQRQYRYPVWQSIDKGTLADSTPFVVPKFNSASGLVATHTEAVEPTPGVFTATSQTITPTAVSGKVEITREAWDQGGNPQLSGLIWRQMERAWYEALEARAIAVLDAATPTAIALTAGGGTTGQTLQAELIAAIAALQFVRGGLTMTDTATQIDLYKALAGALDNDKRPLFPMIGATNANGQTQARLGAIDVGGILFHPSWALAATGSVVASSYLYDRESVHGWATAPQRLEFQYRVAYVDLAVWGYAAAAITDVAGVREITYDPVP